MIRRNPIILLVAALAAATPAVRAEFKPATNEEAMAAARRILRARRELNGKLLRAAGEGRTGLVESLLHQNANVDARDDAGTTPLMLAVQNGDPPTMRLLLRRGANVNIRAQAGTALEWAVKAGRINILDLLLTVKNLNVNSAHGCVTPLILAIQSARLDMVRDLAARGASPRSAAPGCPDAESVLSKMNADPHGKLSQNDADFMEEALKDARQAEPTGTVK